MIEPSKYLPCWNFYIFFCIGDEYLPKLIVAQKQYIVAQKI